MIRNSLYFFDASVGILLASGGDWIRVSCHHWQDITPGSCTQTFARSLLDTRPIHHALQASGRSLNGGSKFFIPKWSLVWWISPVTHCSHLPLQSSNPPFGAHKETLKKAHKTNQEVTEYEVDSVQSLSICNSVSPEAFNRNIIKWDTWNIWSELGSNYVFMSLLIFCSVAVLVINCHSVCRHCSSCYCFSRCIVSVVCSIVLSCQRVSSHSCETRAATWP